MRKLVCRFFLVAMLSIALNAASAFAENKVTVLENGLRVLVVEDTRFPLVSVRLYVHAGGAYETPDKAGISHLLEHMVFRGTEKRPDGSLAKEIESVGGDFNAYTSADETVYYTDLPAKEWKRGIDIVADMALNPIIDAKIMEEEKKVIYAEMGQRREDPNMRLYEDTVGLALEGTSYMHGVLGTEETLATVTAKDVKQYMDRLYNPQNMLLVVVGDVKKDEVINEAKKYFSKKDNISIQTFPSAFELPLFEGTKVVVEESASNKVLMNITFPIPSTHDMRSRTFDVLQIVLGGLDTSILTKKFERDENLVNSISTYNIAYDRVSLFTISVDLEVDKVEAFWKEFTEFLPKLSTDAFTQTQLDSAKFLYENMFQRRKSTISGYASLVGDSEFASPGEFSIDNFLYSIDQVSMENMQKAIDEWIKPSNMAVAVLAPKKAIENKELPNFLEIAEASDISASDDMLVIADMVYYKSYIPEGAKIIEESPERIVIEYSSGSKVILLPDSTMPFFVAELKLVGGNSLLSEKEQGLSSALADMMGVATKSKNRDELSEYLDEKAIGIAVSSTRETFNFTLDSPSQFEKEAFEIFSEIIHKPDFNSNDWKNIHNLLSVLAKEIEEKPDSLLFSELFPTLFTSTNAYGYTTMGKPKTVEGFTLKQVENLWDIQKKQSWIFTIAGDFRLDRALKFVDSLQIRKKAIEPINASKMQSDRENIYTIPEINHEYIMQIFPTVPYQNEDAIALDVLESLLGDMSGILFREIRDKKALAYSVAPIGFSNSKVGFLAFYVNTALENGDKILPAFQEVILDLQNNLIPQEEIDNAVFSMEIAYIKGKQSLGSRVSTAGTNMYLGRSLDYNEEYFEKAKKVTSQDIQRVAKKYLKTENAYLLKVTNK